MDEHDIHTLIRLARIAPEATAEAADWADVLRRATVLAAAQPVWPAESLLSRRQPVPDSVGWGTRPIRQAAAATRHAVATESEFQGWGTRRF